MEDPTLTKKPNSHTKSPKNANQVPVSRVAVGLSGGVDSSIAAFLLKKEGYDVTGVYLQCWDEKADGCSAGEDRSYAVQTAAKLGIKFVHLDFKDQYKETVMKYFYDEYGAGRTPNPDVMCNREIKFGIFFDWAMNNGFSHVATGHYARITTDKDSGIYNMLSGKDPSKDQSYFLYLLDQEHLSRTLFPVGGMTKREVREIAEKEKLPAAKRPDSTGICFIGEIDVRMFLQKRIEPKKGPVVDIDGNIIGEHDGVWFYTIGQRHGFRVKEYKGVPMYVIDKDVKTNTVVVGPFEEVLCPEFEVCSPHWISGDPFEGESPSGTAEISGISCKVRIRHLGKLYDCTIQKTDIGSGAEKIFSGNGKCCEYGLKIILDEKVFGVASGQSAVFYDGETVLGGAVIC